MVDPEGLVVLGTSAPIALKILGPTADYLGDELQHWAEQRVANIQRIFENAKLKLGDDGLNRPGGVPPRVLREVLEEGSYCDDELSCEYFGGILASSKTQVTRDDRGATLAALVGRLSTYQIRSHYFLYVHARRLVRTSQLRHNFAAAVALREEGRFFVPWDAWFAGMEVGSDETWEPIFEHCILGLIREGLLQDFYRAGPPEILSESIGRQVPVGGFVFGISWLGVELFSAAHSAGTNPKLGFLSPDAGNSSEAHVTLSDEIVSLNSLPSL